MKITLLFLFWITALIIDAQPVTFSKVILDANFPVLGFAVVQSYDNAYMIAGEAQGAPVLIKTDSSGDVIWNKTYGSSGFEKFSSVIQTHDSCFVMAGRSYLPSFNDMNVFVVKTDTSGNVIWSVVIDNALNEQAYDIRETSDHGFIVTGSGSNSAAPMNTVVVIKIDSVGSQEWYRNLSGGNNDNYGYSARETPDHGFIVCGYEESFPPYDGNGFLIQFDSVGNVVWAKNYNTAPMNPFFAGDVEVFPNGLLTYFYELSSFVLVKTDFSGNIIWSKSIQIGNHTCSTCIFPKIRMTPDGRLLLISGSGTNGEPGSVLLADTSGNVVWTKSVFMTPIDITASKDSGYYIIGNGPLYGVQNTPVTTPHLGTVKTDGMGNSPSCIFPAPAISFSPVSIITNPLFLTPATTGNSAPVFVQTGSAILTVQQGCVDFIGTVEEGDVDDLLMIFPSPARHEINIIHNEASDNTMIKIYDIAGRNMLEWIPEKRSSATKVSVDFLPGIYCLVFANGNKTSVKKIIIE
jgi:hypothetical protein